MKVQGKMALDQQYPPFMLPEVTVSALMVSSRCSCSGSPSALHLEIDFVSRDVSRIQVSR